MWLVQNNWNNKQINNKTPKTQPTKKYIVIDKKVQCETGKEQNGAGDEIISNHREK